MKTQQPEQNTSCLIDMETLERVAPVLRNIAHPLRLRILDYLNSESAPCSVSDIMDAAESGQAIVSQQLRILKDQGVLTAKRDGNYVLYSITDPSVAQILQCIRSKQVRR